MLFILIPYGVVSQCDVEKLTPIRDSIHHHNFAFAPEKGLEISSKFVEQISRSEIEDCEIYDWIIYERGLSFQLLRRYEEGLNTLYPLIIEAKKNKHYEVVAESYLTIALIHEFLGNREECQANLDNAETFIKDHDIKNSYPRFYIRSSSHYRMIGNMEKARKFAEEAIPHAKAIGDETQELDGYMLLGGYIRDPELAIQNYEKASDLFLKREAYIGAASQTINASRIYARNNKLDQSNKKLNQAKKYISKSKEFNKDYFSTLSYYYRSKKDIFKAKNQLDSAIFYLEKYADVIPRSITRTNNEQLKNTEAKFQLEIEKQKALQIKTNAQHQEIAIWIGSFFLLLLGSLLYFLGRNRNKIKNQNLYISSQNEELTSEKRKSDVLLSEIHHRVKNNLQNIIGLILFKSNTTSSESEKILLQDINSKVLSLSVIHENLYTSGEFENVQVKEYLNHFMNSFAMSNSSAKISFFNSSEREMINIDTMIPLGIIISELATKAIVYNKDIQKKMKIELLNQADNKIMLRITDEDKTYLPQINLPCNAQNFLIIKNMCRQLRGDDQFLEDDSIFEFTFEEKNVSQV